MYTVHLLGASPQGLTPGWQGLHLAYSLGLMSVLFLKNTAYIISQIQLSDVIM